MKKHFYLFLSALILIISIIFIFRSLLQYPLTNDSYLHLGVGKYIINNGKIPGHYDISFKNTIPAYEFIAHSWLADVTFLASYDLGSYGSSLLLLITLLVTSILVFNILSTLKAATPLKILSIALVLLMAPVFYKIHPLIFGILLLTLLIKLHIEWIENNSNKILLLPIVFIAYANFCGGYIFIPGFFLLTILLVETFAFFSKKINLNKFAKLIFSVIASFTASILNPLTYRIWLYFLTFFVVFSSPNKQQSQLTMTLKVINQNYLKQNISSGLYLLFTVYLLFVISGFFWSIIKDGKKSFNYFFHYIPYLFLFIFSLVWTRLLPLSAFATLPLFAKIVMYMDRRIKNIWYFYTGIISLFILLLVSLFFLIYPPAGFTFIPPDAQIAMINRFQLPKNIMASYDINGYLLFNNPKQKVYIDAQDDFFDEYETINYYAYSAPIPKDYLTNLLKRNNVNTFLVAKDTDFFVKPLAADQKNWAMIYLDYNGILFVRKNMVATTFLNDYSLNYVDLNRNLGFNPEDTATAASELEKFIGRYPSVLATGQLASIYRFEGNLNRAENTLLKIPKNQWNYIVNIEMGRIKAAEGLCVDSENYFQEALKDRHEQLFSRSILDLAVLYAGCFGDKDKAARYFQRYQSFPIGNQEREMVQELMKKFGIVIENNN